MKAFLILFSFSLSLSCSIASVGSGSPSTIGGVGLSELATKSPSVSVGLSEVALDTGKFEDGEGCVLLDDLAGAGIGYFVVAVDGEPERRLSHPLITYVPYVAIPPGSHEITLEKSRGLQGVDNPDRFSIVVDLELGKRYQLRLIGSTPSIVEG